MSEKHFSDMIRDFLGILALAFTLFATISLVTYSKTDPSFSGHALAASKVTNLGGVVGAYIADGLAQAFGGGAYLFPLVMLTGGWALIRGKQFLSWPVMLGSGVLFLVAFCCMISIQLKVDPFFDKSVSPGGIVGNLLGSFLLAWLNKVGATLVLSTLLLLSLLALSGLSVNTLIDAIGNGLSAGVKLALKALLTLKQQAQTMVQDLVAQIRESRAARETLKEEIKVPEEPVIVSRVPVVEVAKLSEKNFEKKKEEPQAARKEEKPEFEVRRESTHKGDYKIPPFSLLDDPPPVEGREQLREEILANSKILVQKLADFGVDGRVVQVSPGPFITLFEFEPAPGIKVSRILSLTDDLALAMRAVSVRILAPIPGKPVVGIEIPNSKKEIVSFKEIISSRVFAESSSKLSMVVGKDNIGDPVVQDLATIPHLLIAGSTGSGKSVGLNSMICSILLNATPDEVKMIMIDPKMLELSIYDGIPHLIAPVVTNPKKAAAALQWAVTEMESRYKMMADRGVRNLTGFNELAKRLQQEHEAELEKRAERASSRKADEDFEEEEALPEPPELLPYIVVVIDELADLMMVASKGVEDALTRLAQMARAAGIHLIVATQRPSVDVLTGIIKANFPSRISYKVMSRVDSRTILDAMGAEKLLGKGDMLCMPPGTNRLFRIHGAMVKDEEINRIIKFIKDQKKPKYLDNIFDSVEAESKGADEDEEYDEKYDEAVALVARDKQASISYVQRRLRIGYNRAARIIETMEREGVVGPSDGVKPREIYIKPIPFES